MFGRGGNTKLKQNQAFRNVKQANDFKYVEFTDGMERGFFFLPVAARGTAAKSVMPRVPT